MKFHSKLIGLAFAIVLLALLAPAAYAKGGDSDDVPCSRSKEVGCVLTTLDGVDVHFNGMVAPDREEYYEYGFKWECVELVQRYYAEKHGYPGIWAPGAAYQAFDDWGHPSNMVAYPNGSKVKPRQGDVLVFGPTDINPYGHMAIVKSVQNGQITFVQQNVYDVGEDSLPIDANNYITNRWIYGPVRGWLRDNTPPPLTVVHEESFNLGVPWEIQVFVTAGNQFKVELDGRQIMKGDSNQVTDWMRVEPGEHTMKLYAPNPQDASLAWSIRSRGEQATGGAKGPLGELRERRALRYE